MKRDEAKKLIKDDLENYLTSQNISIRRNFNCLNPEHDDAHPSMSYDRGRNKVHCFSCGADYDTFDLIGIEHGIDLNDHSAKFKKAYEVYGYQVDTSTQDQDTYIKERDTQDTHNTQNILNTQDVLKTPITSTNTDDGKQIVSDLRFKEYLKECHERVEETGYWTSRGLGEDIINRFKLGYDPEGKPNGANSKVTWEVAVIPTGDTSATLRNCNRKADKKDRIRKVGGSPLFNLDALKYNEPCFIVEGEIDALSIEEIGANAVGLGSVANANRLIEHFKKHKPKKTILLCLDNDDEGQKATVYLSQELEKLDIKYLVTDILNNRKDPNEALIYDYHIFVHNVYGVLNELKVKEEEAATEELREYEKNNAANQMADFKRNITSSVNVSFIPTGFENLDKILDGGLYEGLYVVGAISSLGKTTVVLQIADQIAKSGTDVLIFSLEMARSELMAKTISRLTYLASIDEYKTTEYAKTARGITTGKRYGDYNREEMKIITSSFDTYEREYAPQIYISEGLGNIGAAEIRATVEKHKAITGRTPVVIVDYLQILAPYNERSSDKQNTDKAVLELKRISRDFKTPVIAISSLNRQSYNDVISMSAYKESGSIEFSSDVLIGLQLKGVGDTDFDVNEAKQKNPREIEMKILKNRNGTTGDTINFDYFTSFNYFKESTNKPGMFASNNKETRKGMVRR